MKVRTLQLTNYRRHRDVTIEFPDGVFAVVGENGSGKSSILEAIGFALFGAQATRTAKGQLRHAGAAPSDPVRVVLELELSGQAVQVMREFRGVNLTAHAALVVDGKPLVAKGANSHAAVTSEVERLLGMDRTAFFTSIVAQQKELSRLADLTAADRKQLILRMLGIDSLDRAVDEARSRRRAAEARLDGLREAMPDEAAIKASLKAAKAARTEAAKRVEQGAAAWDAAKQALAAAQQAHDAATTADRQRQAAATSRDRCAAALASAKQHAEGAARRLQVARDAADKAQALHGADARRQEALRALQDARRQHDQAAAARRARAEADAVRKQLAAIHPIPDPGDGAVLEAALDQARRNLAAAREAQAARRARAEQVAEHLAGVQGHDDASCPLCERPLEGGVAGLRRRLEAEAKTLRDELATAATAIRALEAKAQEAGEAVTQWQDARRHHETDAARRHELEARLAALEDGAPPQEPLPDLVAIEAEAKAAEAADQARVAAAAQAEALPALEAEAAEAQNAVEAASHALAEADEAWRGLVVPNLEAARGAWDQAQRVEREAERSVTQARTDMALAEQAIRDAEAKQAALADHRKKAAAAESQVRTWAALAGGRNSGLLEQFRSHLVGKIRPAINAEASRLLSRFTDGRYQELILDEDYGVFLVDDGIPHALPRFSGGESDLAHLALRLAVSRLLTHRSGAADLRFLALDEVFGSLDRRRRDAVLAALHGLEDLYSQVVLVTHQEDLREGLDAVLEVRAEGDASVVLFHHG